MMEIKKIRLDELKPYEKNTKLHPDSQVEQICNSIREFGNNDPIAVDEDNVIIEGHGRYLALRRLGEEYADCIILSGMTEEQKNAYRIVHNKLTMNSGFDLDILVEELEKITIDMAQFDLDVSAITEDDIPTEVREDEVPEVDEENHPIAKLGDLYKLGRHWLLCGDSTKKEDVDRLMGGKLADMVFTDHPWNVDYGGASHPTWKKRSIMNDHMETEDFHKFMVDTFSAMNEAAKPGCMVYVVMSAQEWGNMMLSLKDTGFHWSSTIIWNKDRLVLSRKDYHTKYEPIWYGWKEGESRLHPLVDRTQCDVWDFERPSKSDLHPTTKPVGLVAKAIQNSSSRNDVVLDLFGGSGTTLIAAEQTGRECHMMELDPKYVDVIVKRYEALTGEKAELVE